MRVARRQGPAIRFEDESYFVGSSCGAPGIFTTGLSKPSHAASSRALLWCTPFAVRCSSRILSFTAAILWSSELKLIRILTVDDHPLLRQGLAALVNAESDMKLVAEASNGQEAVEKFRLHRPDITLMDLQMPDLNGVEAITLIRREFPDARIIVLTTYTGDAQVLRALKAGARGYILKRQVPKELLDGIRAVHSGHKRIPSESAADLVEHAKDELTPREVDVLRLIAAGNANKQIADQLSIGEASVKSHVANILSKLGANDRAHAVTIGLRRGIIEVQLP